VLIRVAATLLQDSLRPLTDPISYCFARGPTVTVSAASGENRMSGRAVQRVGRLEGALAFLFGSVAIAAVLWLTFRNASLTEPQF